MEENIKRIIAELYYEREYYGDRIVSLHYAYDAALEKLCGLVGKKFKPFDDVEEGDDDGAEAI